MRNSQVTHASALERVFNDFKWGATIVDGCELKRHFFFFFVKLASSPVYSLLTKTTITKCPKCDLVKLLLQL